MSIKLQLDCQNDGHIVGDECAGIASAIGKAKLSESKNRNNLSMQYHSKKILWCPAGRN